MKPEQVDYQFFERLFLGRRARILRIHLRVASTYVADSYRVAVVPAAMGPDAVFPAPFDYRAVAVHNEMIAYFLKPRRLVPAADFVDGDITPLRAWPCSG